MRITAITFLLITSFSLTVFTQTTNEITKDTSLANTYILQAKDLPVEDDQKLFFAKKAWSIYETHPNFPTFLQAKSLYAFALYATDGEKANQLAREVLHDAKNRFDHPANPYTIEAYLTLLSYEMDYRLDYQQALEYGKLIASYTQMPSQNFFELKYRMGICYDIFGEQLNMRDQLRELENGLDEVEGDQYHDANLKYLHLTMLYNWLYTSNLEMVEVYGKKALSEIDSGDLWLETKIAMIMACIEPQYISILEKNIPKLSFANEIQKSAFYSNLGVTYAESGNAEKGLEYCKIALEIGLNQKEMEQSYISHLYHKVSLCYLALKEPEQAVSTIKKAHAYSDHYLFHADLSACYTWWMDETRYLALEPAQKAINGLFPEFNSTNLLDNPDISHSPIDYRSAGYMLYRKAYLLFQKNNQGLDLPVSERKAFLKSVLQGFKSSVHNYELAMEEIQAYQSILLKHTHRTTLIYGYIRLVLCRLYEIEPSQELFDEMHYYTEKRKAIQLLASTSERKLPHDITNQLKTFERAVKYDKQKLATTIPDSLPFYEGQLFSDTKSLIQYRRQVLESFPNYGNQFMNLEFANPQEIEQILDNETIYISFDVQYFGAISGGDWLHMTAIAKDMQKVIQVPQKEILRHIWDLEKLNKNPLLFQEQNRQQFIHHCHQLYRILITPFEEELKGKKKLVLIVEGHLLRIPFEVFLSSGEDKPFQELDYLVRHYDISYHYSGTLYLKTKKRPEIKDHSIMAFAPVFNDGMEVRGAHRSMDFLLDSLYRGTIQNNSFVPLPNSKKEVERISQMFTDKQKVQILLEDEATKTNLNKALKNKQWQFVHLATHGIANLNNPPLSAIACARKQLNAEALAFANEIETKNMKADLVILSTCESGVGQFSRGEGVMALNRSFFISGARNIISSLWKVNDQYSSQLMIEFYRHYFQGKNYAQALRAAKLSMLEDSVTAFPHYWAPFVLIGE